MQPTLAHAARASPFGVPAGLFLATFRPSVTNRLAHVLKPADRHMRYMAKVEETDTMDGKMGARGRLQPASESLGSWPASCRSGAHHFAEVVSPPRKVTGGAGGGALHTLHFTLRTSLQQRSSPDCAH
eukprot:80634-Chlamydomonas_euryale.AAC.2